MIRSFLPAAAFALLASFSLPGLANTPAPVAESVAAVEVPVAPLTKVSLNSADAATLSEGLAGIGEKKAQAIVAHREANGPFTAVDQLLEIKGIGTATLEKNRDRLSLE